MGDGVGFGPGEFAVEVVDAGSDGEAGEGGGGVVHGFDGAGGFVELDVDGLGGLFRGVERGVRLEIVVVELPDEAGLCGVAHPGEDARGLLEHFGVAAFVHGAEGLVVGELGLADEVGEVADVAVAFGEGRWVLVTALGAAGHVVLGPVVVDGLPVFLGHHALDGFDGGDGDGAGFGLEALVKLIEEARRAPVVGAVRGNAAAVGGVRLVKAGGVELGHKDFEGVVEGLGRVALVAGAPDGDGGVVAVADDLVGDVGEVGRNVGDVGAVAGVGLEELVPEQDAVFVGHLVEVGASALADPVADHVEVGEGMHVELRVEALAWDALHALVEAPVAAADHDADTVDGDGEVLGVGDLVLDFADAEVGGFGGGGLAADVEVELQVVEVWSAVAVGPPEFGAGEVEGIERDRCSCVGIERDVAMDDDGVALAGDGSGQHTGDGFGGGVDECGGDGEVGGVVGEVYGADYGGIFDEGGAGGREGDGEPDAGVAVADGGEPVPADGGEKCGAVEGGLAAVLADAEGDGVLVRDAGVGLRRDDDDECGEAAGLDEGGDVEIAADKGSAHGAGLVAVDPDVGRVVDAGEV